MTSTTVELGPTPRRFDTVSSKAYPAQLEGHVTIVGSVAARSVTPGGTDRIQNSVIGSPPLATDSSPIETRSAAPAKLAVTPVGIPGTSIDSGAVTSIVCEARWLSLLAVMEQVPSDLAKTSPVSPSTEQTEGVSEE